MISVVTWDAGFRESYHTVDFFSRQTLDKNQFEFIWADYYSSINPVLQDKIQAMDNGRTLCLGGEGKWHLGRILNAATRESKGDLIVIPDGDIAVEENFLEEVVRCHENYLDLALYFRRWDEQKPGAGRKDRPPISMLKEICKLTNPTNYGGCLTISKKAFDHVHGYEEHELFSEAGANGMDLYTRLKNAGFPIMWHPDHKIYHPWHEGSAPQDSEYKLKVNLQNWVIRQRDLSVTFQSDPTDVDRLVLGFNESHQRPAAAPVQKSKSGFFNKINKFLHP